MSGIKIPNVMVDEDAGVADVCVELSNALDNLLTVTFFTSDISATGMHYAHLTAKQCSSLLGIVHIIDSLLRSSRRW